MWFYYDYSITFTKEFYNTTIFFDYVIKLHGYERNKVAMQIVWEVSHHLRNINNLEILDYRNFYQMSFMQFSEKKIGKLWLFLESLDFQSANFTHSIQHSSQTTGYFIVYSTI